MPDITITMSAAHLERLALLRDQHNEATGESLTTKQFVLQHLKEWAVETEMKQVEWQLANERDRDYDAAVEAERERLLGEMA